MKRKNDEEYKYVTTLIEEIWSSYRKKRQSFSVFLAKVMRAEVNANFAFFKNYLATRQLMQKICYTTLMYG